TRFSRDWSSDVCSSDLPEPLAQEALRFVQRFVAKSGVLHLQHGVEKQDRYGQLLAHVFDESGKSLEQALVEEGLAFHITVGGNRSEERRVGKEGWFGGW